MCVCVCVSVCVCETESWLEQQTFSIFDRDRRTVCSVDIFPKNHPMDIKLISMCFQFQIKYEVILCAVRQSLSN